MLAYVDTSVILRKLFDEPAALGRLDVYQELMTSVLTKVECHRALDRLRLRQNLSEESLAVRLQQFRLLSQGFRFLLLSEGVLERAAQSFPTTLGTLDAIHLATAILWRDQTDQEIVFLTHDYELSLAARASGLSVQGSE